jgi:hypothetical protein
MPDVTINLDQQGFIPLGTEAANINFVAAFPSFNNLVAALATKDERELGYMVVQSVADWYARLTSTYTTGWYIDEDANSDGIIDEDERQSVNATPNGNAAGNWPDGPDDEWKAEWWAVHNYLRYGGTCVIAGPADNLVSTENNALETVENIFLDIDCVFTNDYSRNERIMAIANNRGNCIAVCPVIITSKLGDCANPKNVLGMPSSSTDLSSSPSKLTYHIAGQKLHLGTSQSYVIGDETSDNLISTPLASDAAGCMARTVASGSPYGSPAGIERGRVLDVVRLEYTPTSSDITCLSGDGNKVNYTRTFQGVGTVIFSDKTGRRESQSDPAIFDYVNVSRTYIYLNRTVSNVARRYLFEINDAANRAAFVNTATPILRSVLSAGGISEYSIICDSVNNPQTVIDENGFVADVLFKPNRSIEFIEVRFTAMSGTQAIPNTSTGSGTALGSSTSTSGRNVTPTAAPSSGNNLTSGSGGY